MRRRREADDRTDVAGETRGEGWIRVGCEQPSAGDLEVVEVEAERALDGGARPAHVQGHPVGRVGDDGEPVRVEIAADVAVGHAGRAEAIAHGGRRDELPEDRRRWIVEVV